MIAPPRGSAANAIGKHIVMATMAIAVMFDLMDHFKAQEDVIVMFSLPSKGRGAAHALQ